jgi:uncharacterized membrane protein YoaK (UPF0700 family)
MTGNLVLLGIGLGDRELGLIVRTGIAVAAYGVGVRLGTGLLRRRPAPLWPHRMLTVLCAELVLIVAFSVGWEITGGRPGGAPQGVLIALGALAMGGRGAATSALHVPGISTTYLTGTLTTLLTASSANNDTGWRRTRVAVLVGLLVGATLGGLLALHARRLAPAVLVGALLVAIAGAAQARRQHERAT